jgi:small-conductance mechanosensitive channel
VLVKKSMRAIKDSGLRQLVVAGGVGANRELRRQLDERATKAKITVYYPEFEFCTDNGAMIALAGALRFQAAFRSSQPAPLPSGRAGRLTEIGLFASALNTPDNVLTLVGNAKIFSDTIQNFSANAFRRVDLKCQLAGSADHVAAMELLREKIAGINNVMEKPGVEVEILEFNLVGPVLAVRPYCHTDNYWQVYFDGNRCIRESLSTAGFPAPMPAQVVMVQQQ